MDLCCERCCGMLYTDTGNLGAARRSDELNVADLLPLIESGAEVVIPGPSCSLWIKEEYQNSWAATPRARWPRTPGT